MIVPKPEGAHLLASSSHLSHYLHIILDVSRRDLSKNTQAVKRASILKGVSVPKKASVTGNGIIRKRLICADQTIQ